MDSYIYDKHHEKNTDAPQKGRIIISADNDDDLHEITVTCLKTLNENGAWDFETASCEGGKIITFKYNGTIAAADAVGKLHFGCKYTIKSEWE